MSAIIAAVEGIDGAGKSHLCEVLAERLRRRGLRVCAIDKHQVPLGDDFGGRRMAELRSVIWPDEAEPMHDPLGTHFYLHLLVAWFSGLARLESEWRRNADMVLIDGSFYRVIAKAHARASLDVGWLTRLFEHALHPDKVLMLDIDPADAWRRRAAFKTTEIGRWDGHRDDARSAFCAYQARIRQTLLDFARQDRWTMLPQGAATTPGQTAECAERALLGRLAA